jgi:hypothetical protein
MFAGKNFAHQGDEFKSVFQNLAEKGTRINRNGTIFTFKIDIFTKP